MARNHPPRSRGPAQTRVVALAAGVVAVGLAGVASVVPRVHVTGSSMVPTLHAGDRLAVVPFPVRAGRLVVVRDPRLPSRTLVKRAEAIGDGGEVWVAGDNPAASTDSRHFGPVPRALVVGRPLYRYDPAEAAGWLWTA